MMVAQCSPSVQLPSPFNNKKYGHKSGTRKRKQAEASLCFLCFFVAVRVSQVSQYTTRSFELLQVMYTPYYL